MSIRVDTANWVVEGIHVGNRGLGVTGAIIRSTTGSGESGPGILYDDWDSSADDAKEFRAWLISGPSAGVLKPQEDGSFILSGAPSGAYSITYRLDVDGASQGDATETIYVGLSAVQSDLAAAYVVVGAVERNLSAAYSVIGAAQRDLESSYIIEADGVASRDFTAAYVVVGSAQRDLTSAFTVSQTVQASLVGAYDIITSVATDLSASWAVSAGVQRDLSASYQVQGEGGADPAAVWGYTLSNGLTAEQTLMQLLVKVDALYRIHGLDPTAPLVVTNSLRTAGDIEQTIAAVGDSVTMTRQ